MKPTTKSGATASNTTPKSLLELVEQRIPIGKFKGLTKLLEPHEMPKAKRQTRSDKP